MLVYHMTRSDSQSLLTAEEVAASSCLVAAFVVCLSPLGQGSRGDRNLLVEVKVVDQQLGDTRLAIAAPNLLIQYVLYLHVHQMEPAYFPC